LNWLGWREAEPILAGAQLRDGDVAWPLGDGVQVSARRVEAVMEFRPGEILLKRGRGQILGFDLELQGRVGLEAGREIAPPNEIFGRVWKDVERRFWENWAGQHRKYAQILIWRWGNPSRQKQRF